jgi:hypothetical protein
MVGGKAGVKNEPPKHDLFASEEGMAAPVTDAPVRRRKKNKEWEFVEKLTVEESEQLQFNIMREGYVKGRSNKSARSTVREYLCAFHRYGCKYTKRLVTSTLDPDFVVLEEVNDHTNHDSQATRSAGMTEAQKAFVRYAHDNKQTRPLQTLRFFSTKRKRGEDVPPDPTLQQITNFNTYEKKKLRTLQEQHTKGESPVLLDGQATEASV